MPQNARFRTHAKSFGRPARPAAVLFAVIMAGTVSTSPAEREPEGAARAKFLMGTRLTIECRGEVADRLLDEAFDGVARLEGILSNWIETSEVSRLNREGARAPFPASADLLRAVEAALKWAERTGGAFDPTVESLVQRYGLREMNSYPEPPLMAADDRVAGAADEDSGEEPGPAVGWQYVKVDNGGRAIHFTRVGIGVDLGGIGKGIALDEAARILLGGGVAGALLDFGGQVIAVGDAAPEEGWIIGIADPAWRERAVATVNLRRGSLATSGNSERAVLRDRMMVGHILDPRSGAPALFSGSVSVLAEDGTAADALSTALFVMGPERGVVWAEERGIAALYVRRTEDRDIVFIPTRAMRAGIDWAPVEHRVHPETEPFSPSRRKGHGRGE